MSAAAGAFESPSRLVGCCCRNPRDYEVRPVGDNSCFDAATVAAATVAAVAVVVVAVMAAALWVMAPPFFLLIATTQQR